MSVYSKAGLAAGFVVVAMSWFGGGYVSPAEAACRQGYWSNKDGTCTLKGYYHCNVNGVNWQCPGRTGRCRLTNGNKQCV
jgi:hypothetical protein